MIRTFRTHAVRPCTELTGCLWSFSACQGERAGIAYRVSTPGCWESLPDFAAYRGQGEYSTTFTAGGNIRLEFKGVCHTAEVFLDGSLIARHYNAYTAFDAVIPDVGYGTHTLVIRADNRFSETSALHIPNDYMSYGGIGRPVVLEQIGDEYIRHIHVTPAMKNGLWTADVEVAVCGVGHETCADICVEIAGQTYRWDSVSVPADGETSVRAGLVFEDVRPWSPDSPVLYSVTGTLSRGGEVIDDLIDRFGFRQVEVSGRDILLNGSKVLIKGLCRHEDHPQFACALPFAAMAADLELIRNLGANSVRTAHYPNDEVFLDLCDELGILVWEENHARGLNEEQMRNPNFEEQAEQVIREMIPAHYNHPSIYIWGILNECASDTAYGRECYRKQIELIRSLDSSRPTSFASCRVFSDICLDLPEVVSYNIYPLWYLDTPPEEYLNRLYNWVQAETDGTGKPFLITEIGAGGLYGYRNSSHSKWTEEYQAEALRRQLTAVLGHSGCSGVYIWQFCDVRISEECFGGRPRTMNNKGIVDEYRRPKLCCEAVRELFRKYH